jgi:hypothetical protein
VSTSANPYLAPKATVEDVLDLATSDAEAVRREHINHEASLKSIGLLYYLGGIGLIGGIAASLASLTHGGRGAGALLGVSAILAILAVAVFAVGRGLRTLRPGARIPATILAAIGLLGFPFGTLINGYVLWLIHSRKGRRVLSPDYAAIVEATPQVKYRTPLLVWGALGLLVLTLVGLVLAGLAHR